ncbi:MAG: carboxypeptidase-like regulatory domain-containing protein [Bacteroidales bacterium]|nr:carboxypeptidase-like regulatory domain-containing protein [Bacteroidales bacterium]
MNYFQKLLGSALFFFLITIHVITAQTGSISGFIYDSKTKEPLTGAAIQVAGTTNGMTAGLDGEFKLSALKPGKYTLLASFISYKKTTIPNVIVTAGKETKIEINMEDANLVLNDVTVMAQRKLGTKLSVMMDVKTSIPVVSGISAQQIAKTQDNDAAEVLKRIPGVTIVDDRFIVVRGLAQRYNSVWLNNATTPSSETDSKAFSFDVLPSSLIDNLMIYKSPSPELPADFTGGFVKILTKNVPEENNTYLQYAIGGNSSSTFADMYRFEGTKWDILALGANARMLPTDAPSNLNNGSTSQAVQLSKELNNRWNINQMKALPDQKIGLVFNRLINFGEYKLGNVSAINYSYSNQSDDMVNNQYSSFDVDHNQSNPRTEFQDQQYKTTVKVGALFNWSLVKNDGTKYQFRNFFNQKSTTSFTKRMGIDYYSTQNWRFLESLYTARTTFSSQLSGDYKSKDELRKTDWVLGYAYAGYNEPDRRIVGSIFDDNNQNYRVNDVNRYYQQLNDHSFSGGTNLEKKINFSSTNNATFKTGLYGEYKMRFFDARRFAYNLLGSGYSRSDENLSNLFADSQYSSDKIYLREITNKSDSYQSDNTVGAGYVSAIFNSSTKLTASFGARVEYNQVKLDGYESDGIKPVHINNQSVDLFPSLNVTYRFSDKNLFRVAAGRTINRAEIREIVPYVYYNFDLFANISGNMKLKDAYINNYDIRYEWYPSAGETVTIGGFYKDFSHPIEQTFFEVGSGNVQYTFNNANKATCYGAEVDIKKNLDFINLSDLSVVFNGALIKSKVVFDKGSVERERPLQGQSPYLINTGLFYQNDKIGFSATLLYNKIGKRIETVGVPKQNPNEDIPDIYEMPRNLADIILVQKIGKQIEIKAGIKNLLNAPVLMQQDIMIHANGVSTNHEQIIKKYTPGLDFSLGFSLKL